jgi:hypothetical protein
MRLDRSRGCTTPAAEGRAVQAFVSFCESISFLPSNSQPRSDTTPTVDSNWSHTTLPVMSSSSSLLIHSFLPPLLCTEYMEPAPQASLPSSSLDHATVWLSLLPHQARRIISRRSQTEPALGGAQRFCFADGSLPLIVFLHWQCCATYRSCLFR